jgi:hypothetical protein
MGRGIYRNESRDMRKNFRGRIKQVCGRWEGGRVRENKLGECLLVSMRLSLGLAMRKCKEIKPFVNLLPSQEKRL